MKSKYFLLVLGLCIINSPLSFCQTKVAKENDELRRQVVILSSKVDSLNNVIRLLQDDRKKTSDLSLPWDQLEMDTEDMETMLFNAGETPEEKIQRRLADFDFRVKVTYNETLLKYVRCYSTNDKFRTDLAAKRYDKYEKRISEIFKKYGLPEFLFPLCIVESACKTSAVSRAGAAGMWQLMPGTASELGLTVDDTVDERYDFEKSTDAAARYLKHTFSYFGDWRLTIAAYNCGPQRVENAIKKAGSKEYWSVSRYLPKETQGYLPSLIAVLYYLDYAR